MDAVARVCGRARQRDADRRSGGGCGVHRVITPPPRRRCGIDWTCRAGRQHLQPARYWYRWSTRAGSGSHRPHAHRTAIDRAHARPGSPTSVTAGACPRATATLARRMKSTKTPSREERLGWNMYGRFHPEGRAITPTVQGVLRSQAHLPITFPKGKVVTRGTASGCRTRLEDYRLLQGLRFGRRTRARLAFVCVQDNHGISRGGWRVDPGNSLQHRRSWVPERPVESGGQPGARFEATSRRACSRRLEAGHLQRADGPKTCCSSPATSTTPARAPANNLAAINSLIIYRALRWGPSTCC